MPIERRGDAASRNVSLGFPLLGAVVSRETGSTGGASERPRRRSSPPSSPSQDEPLRTAKPAEDDAGGPAGVALLDTRGPTEDRDAASGAAASFGVSRDDGIWITECAWCMRVHTGAGTWVAITAATRAAMQVERTHGICPQCSAACLARASDPSHR